MLKKVAALVFLCVSSASWFGCGSTASHFVFVTVPAANAVTVYREDRASGLLTLVPGSPFVTGTAPSAVVVTPSKKFAYVANASENDMSLFTISSDGALTEVTPRTLVGGTPQYLAMDAAGGFLFVGDAGSFDIAVFSIGSSGALTPVPGSPFPIGVSPTSLRLTPAGNFLYVTSGGTPGFVSAFGVSAGVLSPVAGSPFTAG